jgi:hypothetical protein
MRPPKLLFFGKLSLSNAFVVHFQKSLIKKKLKIGLDGFLI